MSITDKEGPAMFVFAALFGLAAFILVAAISVVASITATVLPVLLPAAVVGLAAWAVHVRRRRRREGRRSPVDEQAERERVRREAVRAAAIATERSTPTSGLRGDVPDYPDEITWDRPTSGP